MQQIASILRQHLRQDIRDFTSVGSIGLFIVGATFISLKCFVTLHGVGWIALFWILFLFSILNLVQNAFKSSRTASRETQYVYFSALSVVIGTWLYHFLYLLGSALLLLLAMTVFFGSPISDLGLFLLNILIGSLGLCTVLTMTALIGSTVTQSNLLVSLLSIPLALPFLLLSVKISVVASGLIKDTAITTDLIQLSGITLLAIAIGILLIPTLWKS